MTLEQAAKKKSLIEMHDVLWPKIKGGANLDFPFMKVYQAMKEFAQAYHKYYASQPSPPKEGEDIPQFLQGTPTEKDIAWAKEVIRKYEAGEYTIAKEGKEPVKTKDEQPETSWPSELEIQAKLKTYGFDGPPYNFEYAMRETIAWLKSTLPSGDSAGYSREEVIAFAFWVTKYYFRKLEEDIWFNGCDLLGEEPLTTAQLLDEFEKEK